MAKSNQSYPANLDIDYPTTRDRFTVFVRLLWSIPALVLVALLTGSASQTFQDEAGKQVSSSGGGIATGLFAATALMILFRQRYPRWWFDFNLELSRFSTRVGAYLILLTDQYPSTVDKQSVHLNIDYPNAKKDLNRWLPLVKWFLAIPHYLVLFVLFVGVVFATVIAWFSIVLTGNHPKSLFDFAVGVGRYSLRVEAYAFLLTTDKYPPFSLE